MQLIKAKRSSTLISLFLAALTLLTQARLAMAEDSVPFKGKEVFVSSTPVSFSFPLASNLTVAEGRLTHFGHYTLTGLTVINVLLASATATSTMTFANGDMLFLTSSGYALQPFSLKETVGSYTVTGGTGRFEGATGGWIFDAHFDFAVNAGVPVNAYTAVLKGSFSFPDSEEEDTE
jgi:hypothetical protein